MPVLLFSEKIDYFHRCKPPSHQLNRIIISILFFCCTIGAKSQKHLAIDLLEKNGKSEIPFKYKNGFIIVEIWLQNYVPLNFIVDTGAEHTIIFKKDITNMLNVQYERRISVIGSDLSSEMFARIVRNINIKLSDLPSVQRDVIVLEEDYLHMSEINGVAVDGILGGEFFKGLVLEIDFDHSKLKLYHPDQYEAPKDLTKHDIEVKNHKPYITANYLSTNPNIKDTSQIALLLDTGAAITFMLFTNIDSTILMPEHAIPGNLGKGLGGNIQGYVGKSQHIGVDDYEFDRVITYYQKIDSLIIDPKRIKRQGLIGNLVLSRFDKVVIDYAYEKLYLQPIEEYNKPFEYDKSGLNIYAVGPKLKTYLVYSVLKDSPADKAGIQAGDMITRIGCWSTRWYTLEGLAAKLSDKAGTKIKLQLKRYGFKFKRSFVLKDLFSE